jgi:uncharacterized membrane protein YeaQ/YmgE (transglycosylase-associated protein family)
LVGQKLPYTIGIGLQLSQGATLMLNIVFWIIGGAIAGWLASIIMRTNKQQGLLTDIVLGIAGAFVGGFVFSLFGTGGGVTGPTNPGSIFVAVVGAVILTAAGKFIRGRGK